MNRLAFRTIANCKVPFSNSKNSVILRIPQSRCIHSTAPLLKRSVGKKDRYRELRRAKRDQHNEDKEDLEYADEWFGDEPDPITLQTFQTKKFALQNKRVSNELDVFEMQYYRNEIALVIEQLEKGAHSIKIGRSNPELMRALVVELPKDLGGKVIFDTIASVAPKPGDARSLLITVFDPKVYWFDEVRLMVVYETYYSDNCSAVSWV
jgi:hypothetical protein